MHHLIPIQGSTCCPSNYMCTGKPTPDGNLDTNLHLYVDMHECYDLVRFVTPVTAAAETDHLAELEHCTVLSLLHFVLEYVINTRNLRILANLFSPTYLFRLLAQLRVRAPRAQAIHPLVIVAVAKIHRHPILPPLVIVRVHQPPTLLLLSLSLHPHHGKLRVQRLNQASHRPNQILSLLIHPNKIPLPPLRTLPRRAVQL
jgi:hypothetical protein